MRQVLDLNAALDSADPGLLDILTSATVSLGPAFAVRRLAEATARCGISLGAQITSAIDPLYQLGALDAVARAAGTRIGFVRTDDESIADALVAAVADHDKSIQVVVRPGSRLLTSAYRAGLSTVREGLASAPPVPHPRTLRLPTDPHAAGWIRCGLLAAGVRLAAFTGTGGEMSTPPCRAATDTVSTTA